MSRIMHFVADIMNPKNSASRNFLTFSMSDHPRATLGKMCIVPAKLGEFYEVVPRELVGAMCCPTVDRGLTRVVKRSNRTKGGRGEFKIGQKRIA